MDADALSGWLRARLEESDGHPSPVIEMARRLVASPACEPYWRLMADKIDKPGLIDAPRGSFWSLATVCAIVELGENIEGAEGAISAPDGWFFKPRSERREAIARVEKLAQQLREAIKGTPIGDPTTWQVVALGKVRREDQEARWDGPTLSQTLSGLEAYAAKQHTHVADQPVVNRGPSQRLNLFLKTLVHFHMRNLDTSISTSWRRSAELASAVFEREITWSEARDASK